MIEPVEKAARLISAREVQSRTSLSRTSLWRLVRKGEFPAPARLGGNRIAWLESSVSAWIAQQFDDLAG